MNFALDLPYGHVAIGHVAIISACTSHHHWQQSGRSPLRSDSSELAEEAIADFLESLLMAAEVAVPEVRVAQAGGPMRATRPCASRFTALRACSLPRPPAHFPISSKRNLVGVHLLMSLPCVTVVRWQAGPCGGRKAKRAAAPSAACRAVRLKWVRGSCVGKGAEEEGEEMVLESFELVPLPSPEPQPDAELSIAAAALLANIAATTMGREHARSPSSVIVTATVPLVEHASGACTREVLKPVSQERLP